MLDLHDFEYSIKPGVNSCALNEIQPWCEIGQIKPNIGHVYGYRLVPEPGGASTVVTSFYDWSDIDPQWREAGIFPVMSELALRATLGILDRTVRRGYPH